MRTKNRMFALVATVAFLGLAPATPASAQLAHASATTLGLGGNATATARGFGAISVNPAGLGMARSGFTLAVIPVTVREGLAPVTLSDLKDYGGSLIPASTKEAWLARVTDSGQQRGGAGVEVSGFAFAVGHVGFQLSTLAKASMDLAPDVVEAALYGNAGRTGSPADLYFDASSLDAFGVTTAGLSLGWPLSTEAGEMALGATLKYSVGHVVAVGRDQGGRLESDPVRVDVKFPMITFDEDGETFNNGSGIGLDVGFQLKRDRVSLGAAVLNVFNTFSWNGDRLVYRPGTVLFEEGNNESDFDPQPAVNAPAGIRQVLDDMKFDPTISVGAAYDVDPDFTVSADIRNRFGDGMSLLPKLHAGVGAEYRGVEFLHLRGGLAAISDGFQFGGGLSLILGPVNLSFAGAMQTGDFEDTNVAQFTLSFGGR